MEIGKRPQLRTKHASAAKAGNGDVSRFSWTRWSNRFRSWKSGNGPIPIFCFLLGLFLPLCAAAQDIRDQGGALTTDFSGHNAIQVAAPNVTDEDRRNLQLSGFGPFHRINLPEGGLGPRFVNSSCAGCHVQNGKGPLRFSRAGTGSTIVVKVALKDGINPDGSPLEVPGVGAQLQDNSTDGKRFFRPLLNWQIVDGRYPDRRAYQLRKPQLSFSIAGINRRKLQSSMRMSPLLVGMGLLEAIPVENILALEDPNDANGDGISGRANYVFDRKTGNTALGRFGFKATHPSVEQQTAAAFFFDIGMDNSIFHGQDAASEVSGETLNSLVVYQQIPGVPRARNQDDPGVLSGKSLFQTIGCSSCHTMTQETKLFASAPELENQVIHPFTDLLLHDMGPGLADTLSEFGAKPGEWRTTPLWGLGFAETLSSVRPLYLHDGRARTIEEAILWHGGEAKSAMQAFKKLKRAERKAVITFLRSL